MCRHQGHHLFCGCLAVSKANSCKSVRYGWSEHMSAAWPTSESGCKSRAAAMWGLWQEGVCLVVCTVLA